MLKNISNGTRYWINTSQSLILINWVTFIRRLVFSLHSLWVAPPSVYSHLHVPFRTNKQHLITRLHDVRDSPSDGCSHIISVDYIRRSLWVLALWLRQQSARNKVVNSEDSSAVPLKPSSRFKACIKLTQITFKQRSLVVTKGNEHHHRQQRRRCRFIAMLWGSLEFPRKAAMMSPSASAAMPRWTFFCRRSKGFCST